MLVEQKIASLEIGNITDFKLCYIYNCPQFNYYRLAVILKHAAAVVMTTAHALFNMFWWWQLTCGYSFLGSTLLSMANTNAAVFPVPDWDWAIMFCGLQENSRLLYPTVTSLSSSLSLVRMAISIQTAESQLYHSSCLTDEQSHTFTSFICYYLRLLSKSNYGCYIPRNFPFRNKQNRSKYVLYRY